MSFSDNNIPVIAVVVPVRNEEKYIGKLIESVVKTHFPKSHLQLIICDGQSTDNTRSIIEEQIKHHKWISILDNPNRTTPYAFNMGIRYAKNADIIITVGGHSELHSNFFDQIVETFKISDKIGCVGGVSENSFEDDISQAIGHAMSSPFGVGNAHFRTGNMDGYVDTVSFPAYKKEVFEKVGLFNVALTRNQDDEFNYRVAKAGFKIYLNRQIKSKYHVRGDYSKLFNQYYQYGYWKVYVNKIHNTVTTTRQLIPPVFVAFLGIGFFIALISWFLAGMYVGIIALYLLGALFFASKKSASFVEVMRIVYAFFTMHIGYGTGYITSLWQIMVLGKKPNTSVEKLTR